MKLLLSIFTILLCGCTSHYAAVESSIQPASCKSAHCVGIAADGNQISVYLLNQYNEIKAVQLVLDGNPITLEQHGDSTLFSPVASGHRISKRQFKLNSQLSDQFKQATRISIRVKLKSYSIENGLKDIGYQSPAYLQLVNG